MSSAFRSLVGSTFAGSDWQSNLTFTPVNFGTVTNNQLFYRRVGDTMVVRGSFKAGTVAAAIASITLPTGYAIDTSKVPAAVATYYCGTWLQVRTGAANTTTTWQLFYDGSDTSSVYFSESSGSTANQITKRNADSCVNSSDTVSLEFAIPISGWNSTQVVGSNSTSEIWVGSGSGWGSTNTKIRIFSTTLSNIGSDITYATSSTLGDSFTINTSGTYDITYTDYLGTSGSIRTGVSVNTSAPTTVINSVTYAQGWRGSNYINSSSDKCSSTSVTLKLSAGDVVRAHDGAEGSNGSSYGLSWFKITKVY